MTSKPCIVDLDDMLQWIEYRAHRLMTYASSSDEPKCLEICLSGGYVVSHGDVVVYSGTDGRTAVNAYNNIGRRDAE